MREDNVTVQHSDLEQSVLTTDGPVQRYYGHVFGHLTRVVDRNVAICIRIYSFYFGISPVLTRRPVFLL